MSFITPDVMWAMRSAADYDIEIVGDRLFLYGPIYNPNVELPDMSAKLADIKRTLLVTTAAYRDVRLPYDQGKQRVSALGAELKPHRSWKYASLIIFLLYIIISQVITNISTH